MSLSKFSKKRKETLLVFDISNLVYRTLYTAYKDVPVDEEFILWKSMVLERIIYDIKHFKPSRVIIALDDKTYWRKDIYPDYKCSRKKNRADSHIDFDEFFPVLEQFIIDLEQIFPNMYFIKVPTCEADDIIAILTKEKWKKYNVICLSNDSDLHQLLKYKHYQQYNPLKMQFVNSLNFKRELQIKILSGDRSDDIPNILPKIGPVTAGKMLDEGLDEIFKKGKTMTISGVKTHIDGKTIKTNYRRNQSLIDMDMIPFNISKKIIDIYESIVINKYNGKKVYKYLMNNNLIKVLEDLEGCSDIITNLN